MPLLEAIQEQATMTERLLAAALRIKKTLEQQLVTGQTEISTYTLRPEQIGVYADCVDYLIDASQREKTSPPMGRIILPPRTGKTIIAGQLAPTAGLIPTFIVGRRR